MQALCIFVVLLVSQIAVAGTHSDFESYKQQQTRGAAAARDDFEVYKQKLLAAFEHYKKQTGKVWGNKHNVSPQASNWISFHGDLGHRSVVDFDQGVISIEVAIPAQQSISKNILHWQHKMPAPPLPVKFVAQMVLNVWCIARS